MVDRVEDKPRVVEIPSDIPVRDLADRLELSPVDLLKALIANGIMASITESIDFETAAIVAEDFGVSLVPEGTLARQAAAAEAAKAAEAQQLELGVVEEEPPAEPAEEEVVDEGPQIPWYIVDEPEDALVRRAPVVSVLGHVDHGKTSLLDAIRDTSVASGESGGITQHIGAYTVERDGHRITFIDTPGHEAFTAMRARGAQATDIAIIVVAADDGVMPQTREALDHARAAHVPLIIAVNKIDLDTSRPQRVLEQLAELDVVPEDWGGETFFVPVSAVTGEGLPELLDAILLVAEDAEPMANPERPGRGTVLEGRVDPHRGAIATVLVLSGHLRQGDTIVVGTIHGRVRAMFDESGERIRDAGPATPVEIMGLSEVPKAGSRVEVVENDRQAKRIVAEREEAARDAESPAARPPMTLEELFAMAQAGEVKTLNLVVKTDVQGMLEPVVESLERLEGDARVEILHAATGEITGSDVDLAAASGAVVIGFRVSPDTMARREAAAQRVEIREYDVIYKLIEDVQDALTGMLEPEYEDVTIGQAEVRAVFSISRLGKVAGCHVSRGLVRRNATVRVLREDEEISRSGVSSLKRFTEDVREVREGFECGIGLASFDDFEEGDILEFFVQERVR
jgi:translation initiation factor IF-2